MYKVFDLTGKVAVVTGGGRGIGGAIAIALANDGASVSIFDMNKVSADKVVAEISNEGGTASSFECDASSAKNVLDAFRSALGDETLDILINNAGIAYIGNVTHINN